MMAASTTHLVLIPSYNPGAKVYETVRAARRYWSPVWVVVDGSTDDSAERLTAMAAQDADLRPWYWACRYSMPVRRACACRAGASPTVGPIWKRCGPALATPCSAFAS